jgi:SGNH hydrolase-like domain, acetyltransferase AlgX
MGTGGVWTLRSRPILSGFCLIVAGVTISLMLGEGLLRLLANRLPGEIEQVVIANPDTSGVRHPYIGHLHRPNAERLISGRGFRAVHRTDEFGFRNPAPWPQRAEIVAVGDSLTFGYGVRDNEAWPKVIDQALPGMHTINLGLIGAGPEQYYRLYETFGRKLQPKLLLVGLFVRNDFWDADLFDRWLKSGSGCNYMVWRDYGRPRDCANSLRWKASLWVHSSHLYNLFFWLAKNARQQFKLESEIFRFDDGRRLRLEVEDFEAKTIDAQRERPQFQLVLRALQKMHAVANEDRTRMLIVFQPSKEEVYLPLLRGTVLDPSRPLREELTKSGIDYLNLTAVFRKRAAKGEKLFFETDGHPNAAGQELIAEAVLAHLKNNPTKYDLQDLAKTSSPHG